MQLCYIDCLILFEYFSEDTIGWVLLSQKLGMLAKKQCNASHNIL